MNKIKKQIGQSDWEEIDFPTKKHLCGNVYKIDLSSDKVYTYNVFNNSIIQDAIYKTTRDYLKNKNCKVMPKNYCGKLEGQKQTPRQWGESEILTDLRGEFWGRCQYEMSIQSKFTNDFPKPYLCIDVFSQLQLNWEHFINYLESNIKLIMSEFKEAHKEREKARKDFVKMFGE